MTGHKHYYVDQHLKCRGGNHIVHVNICKELSAYRNYLGYLTNCKDALVKAKNFYNNVELCALCCKDSNE